MIDQCVTTPRAQRRHKAERKMILDLARRSLETSLLFCSQTGLAAFNEDERKQAASLLKSTTANLRKLMSMVPKG
jgi:hypothetical protein